MTFILSQSVRLPDGRSLAYTEYGAPDGKPVLYFHGLPGSRLDPAMLDNGDLVKAGIRMIACDRPGMGGSDFQPGRSFSHWPADMLPLPTIWGWASSPSGAFQAAADMYLPAHA
jgi:pimeloyl-ACP methyl ester carboxylesterase